MGRLILLIVVGLGIALYFPRSRAVLFEKGEPVLRPVLSWSAQREMEQIAAGIQDMEEEQRRIPDQRGYAKWLDESFTADIARDPWGNLYGYELKPDSFAIISDGPDRTLKTPDDIREVRVRNWKAKGSENARRR